MITITKLTFYHYFLNKCNLFTFYESIKLDPLYFQQLGGRGHTIYGANGEAIRLGNVVDMIGANHAAGAWHVLDNDSRFSRDIFGEVLGQNPGHAIIPPARRKRDNNLKYLPLVIGCSPEFTGKDEEGNNK